MAIAKWATPSARSSNLAGTALNSLANTAQSATITYDNSTNRDLYGTATIKLGTVAATTSSFITLRASYNDGTDTPDRIGGDQYVLPVSASTSAKVVVANMVRLYPYSMRFSVINNVGTALSGSGNELYIRPWNEDIA